MRVSLAVVGLLKLMRLMCVMVVLVLGDTLADDAHYLLTCYNPII